MGWHYDLCLRPTAKHNWNEVLSWGMRNLKSKWSEIFHLQACSLGHCILHMVSTNAIIYNGIICTEELILKNIKKDVKSLRNIRLNFNDLCLT
jgi:hypothetical protein